MGIDLELRAPGTTLPLQRGWEHALVVAAGDVVIGDEHLGPGQIAYVGTACDELRIQTATRARALLVGGPPFEEPLLTGESVDVWRVTATPSST